MAAILDAIGAFIESWKDADNLNPSWKRKIIHAESNETTIIFLGWRNKINLIVKKLYKYFPGQTLLVYEIPNTLLSKDLKLMQKSWGEVTQQIEEDFRKFNVKTIFGLSLGTSLALYTANHHSKNIKK